MATPTENCSLQPCEESWPSCHTAGKLISHVNPVISENDLLVLNPPRFQSLQGWSCGMSSVQLSPAPSSLGSSHEELSITVTAPPWPAEVWHCFQSGVLVKINDPTVGSDGMWKASDELAQSLRSSDWPQLLRLEGIQEVKSGVLLSFACLASCSSGAVRWEGDLVAQCHVDHVFYVRDKGELLLLCRCMCVCIVNMLLTLFQLKY
ncbi:hypothetical protein PR048_001154 [Dryococelus australis]|uniref:Uncharacterized protein n=1 Tax=Dryococelus australis TaxID=614101 RepID=A0ABQ9IGN8_9NEOP|nr:hypothetical protein PR048_001154 [Dryococelus australis]